MGFGDRAQQLRHALGLWSWAGEFPTVNFSSARQHSCSGELQSQKKTTEKERGKKNIKTHTHFCGINTRFASNADLWKAMFAARQRESNLSQRLPAALGPRGASWRSGQRAWSLPLLHHAACAHVEGHPLHAYLCTNTPTPRTLYLSGPTHPDITLIPALICLSLSANIFWRALHRPWRTCACPRTRLLPLALSLPSLAYTYASVVHKHISAVCYSAFPSRSSTQKPFCSLHFIHLISLSVCTSPVGNHTHEQTPDAHRHRSLLPASSGVAYAAATGIRDADGWWWHAGAERERKKRKRRIFEAKFSCRVNWMMNDGRCMLNCIPLAEPSCLSAHRSANVVAPSQWILFQGYLSDKLCYMLNIPGNNTHPWLAHPPHLFSPCRCMAWRQLQLLPHYGEGGAFSIQQAAKPAMAQ